MRVLIVDDDADQLNSLAVLLEQLGHEVQTALNGPLAIEAAAKFDPHVAFIDIALPYLNGYEVARAIRKRGLGARLYAITGRPDEREYRWRDAGFEAMFLKPVEFDTIAALLRKGNWVVARPR